MIILTVWCTQWYVWDRIREGYTKHNLTIGVRYVHETLRLCYVSKCYGYERLIKMIWLGSIDKRIRLGYG